MSKQKLANLVTDMIDLYRKYGRKPTTIICGLDSFRLLSGISKITNENKDGNTFLGLSLQVNGNMGSDDIAVF